MNLSEDIVRVGQVKYLDLKCDAAEIGGIRQFFHKYGEEISEEGLKRIKSEIISERRKLVRKFPGLKEFNKNQKKKHMEEI